jgi:hypothetical protein
MDRIIPLAAVLIFALQTTACGMLIYPEREGQTSGKIDPGVAILDAAGLLVFIIPGLVAFGVDFMTGTIYLPETEQTAHSDQIVREISISDDKINSSQIEQIVATETGHSIDLSAGQTRIIQVSSQASMIDELKRSL